LQKSFLSCHSGRILAGIQEKALMDSRLNTSGMTNEEFCKSLLV